MINRISIGTALSVVFALLKVFNIVHFSWLLVFTPFNVELASVLLVLSLMYLI